MFFKVSLSLAGNDLSLVLDYHGKVISDKKVHVESYPLADLINVDAGKVIVKVHAYSSYASNEEPIDASVNQGVGRGGELIAVGADDKNEDHKVEDFTRCKAVGEPHVPAHVIVAVKEADARATDEGYKGGDQQEVVKKGRDKAA